MSPLYAGQHADIEILEPSDRAARLVEQLLEIVRTSAPTTTAPDGRAGVVRVHLTQADADVGAESIRQLAAKLDSEWETLVSITAVRGM
jgi:hypothetical protein